MARPVGPKPTPSDIPHHFGIEPFIGYRMWGVSKDYDGSWCLRGAWGYPWESREETARCIKSMSISGINEPTDTGLHKGKDAPQLECRCGIYAQRRDKPQDAYTNSVTRYAHVAGAIQLWGRVLEGQAGFRGQHARIMGPLGLVVFCSGSGSHHYCDRESTEVTRQGYFFQGICEQAAVILDREVHTEALPVEVFMHEAALALEKRYGMEVMTDGHR